MRWRQWDTEKVLPGTCHNDAGQYTSGVISLVFFFPFV